MNETAFEVYRVWLKVSPQLRTLLGDTSGGVFRIAFELNLLPRRTKPDLSTIASEPRRRRRDKTTLPQLHLYL